MVTSAGSSCPWPRGLLKWSSRISICSWRSTTALSNHLEREQRTGTHVRAPPPTCSKRILPLAFDRHADHVAPFGPRAVIVAHVGVAQQFMQDDPGVRRALTDAAVD